MNSPGDVINLAIAVILMVSPTFFKDHGISPEQIRGTYQAAQAKAEYIIQSGDAGEIEKVGAALQELQKYEAEISTAAPIIAAIEKRLMPEMVMPELPY